jgi:hypothetical protein
MMSDIFYHSIICNKRKEIVQTLKKYQYTGCFVTYITNLLKYFYIIAKSISL